MQPKRINNGGVLEKLGRARVEGGVELEGVPVLQHARDHERLVQCTQHEQNGGRRFLYCGHKVSFKRSPCPSHAR